MLQPCWRRRQIEPVSRATGRARPKQVPGQQPPLPVVSNDFGQGKSLLFAFGLAAMVTVDVVQANG